MENKVSAEIPAENLQAIHDAIQTISDNLPQLVSLTARNKRSLAKMGDKSVAFVNKSLEYVNQNENLVPPFLDKAEFAKDVELINNLTSVLFPLQQLVEKLDDTATQAGSEAFGAALTFYNAVKGAAKSGVPGARSIYEELQQRFAS